MINDEKLGIYFEEELQKNIDGYYYFYGIKMNGRGQMAVLDELSTQSNNHYLIAFNDQEWVFMTMDALGKINKAQSISKHDVTEIAHKKWNFGLGRKIKVTFHDNSSLSFKASRKVMGLKKQAESISQIEKIYG